MVKDNMIKVALFGFGRIGQMHAENLFYHKGYKLVYLYDPLLKNPNKISKKYSVKIIKNYKTALKDKKIDLIFIASPTNTHIKFIEESVSFKKAIFCEKPLDLNLLKIKKSISKIIKYNYKIQLGFNRRYDPGHYSLKTSLEKNKIGNLEKIIITSRDPAPPTLKYLKNSGGIFKDMMIHDFDLCRFYLGKDKITNGAASDIQMVTKARDMVESDFPPVKETVGDNEPPF